MGAQNPRFEGLGVSQQDHSASGKPLIESEDEIPEEGEEEEEEEDLSTEAYNRMMYKRALPQRPHKHVAVRMKHT